MTNRQPDRRAILQLLGAAGALATVPSPAASAPPPEGATAEVLQPEPERKPKYSIRFGVCGMSRLAGAAAVGFPMIVPRMPPRSPLPIPKSSSP